MLLALLLLLLLLWIILFFKFLMIFLLLLETFLLVIKSEFFASIMFIFPTESIRCRFANAFVVLEILASSLVVFLCILSSFSSIFVSFCFICVAEIFLFLEFVTFTFDNITKFFFVKGFFKIKFSFVNTLLLLSLLELRMIFLLLWSFGSLFTFSSLSAVIFNASLLVLGCCFWFRCWCCCFCWWLYCCW